MSRKALAQVRDFVYDMLEERLGAEKAAEVAETLSPGDGGRPPRGRRGRMDRDA